VPTGSCKEKGVVMLSNRVSVTLGAIFVAALVALSCHHGLGGGIGSDFRGFEDATLD
jgi:hypothetical protein